MAIKGAKVTGRFGDKVEPHRYPESQLKVHRKDGKIGRVVDGKVVYDGSPAGLPR